MSRLPRGASLIWVALLPKPAVGTPGDFPQLDHYRGSSRPQNEAGGFVIADEARS